MIVNARFSLRVFLRPRRAVGWTMPVAYPARTAPSILTVYSKTKLIGSGSFGSCFLATDKRTGETCVMKEVSLKGADSKELERACNEATVLRRLKHPNLIAYIDSQVDRAEAKLILLMEWAQGGDLGTAISEKKQRPLRIGGPRFSEDECLKMAAQACSALAYCHHTLFLLHRDIKPQNIFLSASGDVKIGDFGISKCLSASHGLALTKCGSPVYMSPELCSGRPYDRGCDTWALGCVLYEMMTLQTPWLDQLRPRQGMLALVQLVCSGSLRVAPLRQHYSEALCLLLDSMLNKQPQRRPSFNRLLMVPLIKSTLAKLYPESTPPSTPPLTPPLTPTSTPPLTPKSAASDESIDEEMRTTGEDQLPPLLQPMHGPLLPVRVPAPVPGAPLLQVAPPHGALIPDAHANGGRAPQRPLSAVEAAAQHMNIYEAFTRPAEGPNPFNAPQRMAAKPAAYVLRPYGVEAHAAAIALQRSYQAKRAQLQLAQRACQAMPAGMPSRPPTRPAWAPVR